VPVSVSKGYDPGYFLRSAAAGKENYYTGAAESGMEPAGRWEGRGLAALGLAAGSVVNPDTLRNLFTKRIHPLTGEVLGRKPHTFAKLDDEVADLVETLLLEEPPEMRTPERRRELTFMVRVEMGREHVNFYDVGFSVPKSVSLLQVGWSAAAEEARAAGDLERAAECDAKAEEIEQAVMKSARTIVRLAERHVYVRTGHHSETTGEWRDAAGLTAAIFMHHTSRTAAGETVGDPQLHAHIAFWAYAQRADGADDIFRSIDAAGLYQMQSYYAATAELELEQRLQRLGYAIVRRPDGDFEVGGLQSPKVLKQFSARTAEITKELEPQVRAFAERTGHAPSAAARRAMGKNATMKTRRPKDHAPDRARQLAEWDAKYRAAALQALAEIPETVQQFADGAPRPVLLDAVQRVQCIALALATLQRQRATWTWAHLALEIRKTLPVLDDSTADDDIDALVLSMTREALAGDAAVLLKPPPAVEMPGARASSGESVYTKPAEFARYATVEHLLAETRLADDAARPAAPVLAPGTAARAVGSTLSRVEAERARLASDDGAGLDPQALSETGLSNDQALALYGLLTSARAVNVLVGAAGTGKSHVVSRLADIVRAETGGRVVGVTAAENAARVLAGEGLDEAHNIAHFLGYVEGSGQRRGHLPLHAGDWLVVDEAGTADNSTLAELNEVAKARGARLLLTGDPQQFGSVEAGGAMRLIAGEHGYFEIHEVKRFAEAWEGPASLRIRAGDATAVREYIERGRVIEGTEEDVTAQLVRQYTGSLVAGRNALLLTDKNEAAADVAALVRAQLIELGEVDAQGPAVTLADDNQASRGDLVRAMKNSKAIDAGGQKLANRDVLVLGAVDGEHVTARRLTGAAGGQRQYSAPFTVPLAYLREHAALAYGGNIFVGQGRTVDDSYQLLSDATSRESFYVAMTRGRARNVAGVVTERTTDDPLLPGLPPPRKVTAEALLSQAITRERDDLTATEYLREQHEREYSMSSLVGRWQALTRDASFSAYDGILRETLTPEDYQRLASDPERGVLNRRLRAAELTGADAAAILREAIGQRDLASARSVAAVLHGRVARLAGRESHTALDSYTAATPGLADPQAGAAARELARLADERAAELGHRAAADRPVWALHAFGEVPADPAGRGEWLARASKVAAYRELAAYQDPVHPVGPAPKAGAVELRAAWRAAADAAGMHKDDQGIRETSEMLLLAQAQEAARVKAWEPQDVAAERQDTELAKGAAVAEAQLSAAAAGNATAAQARDLAASSKQLAEELAVRAAWLAEQDEHRREWHEAHAAKIERGARARAELERRQEAGELLDEYDVVKAYLILEPEPDAPAAKLPADEPEGGAAAATRERETERAPEPEAAADPQAERAEHFRQVAEHRERAVEHPGRAEIEAAREAQARVDAERAERKLAEPVPHGHDRQAEAEAEADAELEAGA
jgi:conjugative relaxase-like TrwC/TraI family protein